MGQLPDLMPVYPELLLALGGMAMMMVGVFARPDRAYRLVHGLALIVLAVALIMVLTRSGMRVTVFGGMFVLDQFAVFMKALVLIGTIVTLVIGRGFMLREGMARFEYPVLVVFAALGMMMMVSANDLIALYVGLELQSLALYVVAAFQRDSIRSTEAGLKYFVLGALSSGLLLYGASLIYGFAGSTGFETLGRAFAAGAPNLGVVVGLVFLLAGFAFKISAVPFHMWTPDVYEGAPTPVTAFFSIAPKVAAFALLMRAVLDPFGDLIAEWRQVIVVVSILSMVLGALAAIGQTNIKRLMAYSSIGHVGYALIGVAAGSKDGLQGVLIYLALYLVMNVGAFACILSMRRGGRMVENIDDLSGLARTDPRLALALFVFMFSMAGIPPLAGFFGKLYVFLSAMQEGLYTLAVIGVVSSVIAAYYYLRIVKVMYFDEAAEPFDRNVGRGITLVLGASAIINVFFFLWPTPLLNSAAAAATTFFPG
ncbi:MAG: NADH-quinone oxidoreductase subunit NuoN [Alphaproteobacteria bacterium]